MWTKFRSIPWRSLTLVLWHGAGLALEAAKLVELSGLRLNPAVAPIIYVAAALGDAANTHPALVAALETSVVSR